MLMDWRRSVGDRHKRPVFSNKELLIYRHRFAACNYPKACTLAFGKRSSIFVFVMRGVMHHFAHQLVWRVAENCAGSGIDQEHMALSVDSVHPLAHAFEHGGEKFGIFEARLPAHWKAQFIAQKEQ